MAQSQEKEMPIRPAPAAAPQSAGVPGSAVANVAALAVREVFGYWACALKLPVLFCFISMAGAIMAVLQDVYPRAIAAVAPYLTRWAPAHLHLNGADIFKLYWICTTVLYAVKLPLRLLHVRSRHCSYKSRWLNAAAVATLGWGFVLVNVPYVRVAPGTSRIGLAGVFVFFYLLTLVAFSAAVGLSRLGDLVNQASGEVIRTLQVRNASRQS